MAIVLGRCKEVGSTHGEQTQTGVQGKSKAMVSSVQEYNVYYPSPPWGAFCHLLLPEVRSLFVPDSGIALPLSSITAKRMCWCQASPSLLFLASLCPTDLEVSCSFLVVVTGPALSGLYTLTCPSRFPSKQAACPVSSGLWDYLIS